MLFRSNLMNLSAKYTKEAGTDYFTLQSGDKNSVYAFVQNLPRYGLLTANNDAVEFLENLADTTTLGGQAIVGAMREGRNNQRLNSAQIGQDTTPSDRPAVTPVPAVNPVY